VRLTKKPSSAWASARANTKCCKRSPKACPIRRSRSSCTFPKRRSSRTSPTYSLNSTPNAVLRRCAMPAKWACFEKNCPIAARQDSSLKIRMMRQSNRVILYSLRLKKASSSSNFTSLVTVRVSLAYAIVTRKVQGFRSLPSLPLLVMT